MAEGRYEIPDCSRFATVRHAIVGDLRSVLDTGESVRFLVTEGQ